MSGRLRFLRVQLLRDRNDLAKEYRSNRDALMRLRGEGQWEHVLTGYSGVNGVVGGVASGNRLRRLIHCRRSFVGVSSLPSLSDMNV